MRFLINRLDTKNKRSKGFSLTEMVVALLVLALIIGIAVPIYLDQKNKGHRGVAVQDSTSLDTSITVALAPYTAFGTTNGTITVDGSTKPATITVVLGTGATSPAVFTESISNDSSASGITYANTVSWCLDVVNNGQHVVSTESGVQNGISACGATPAANIGNTNGGSGSGGGFTASYATTAFTLGSNLQTFDPTVTGNTGAVTYSITSGTLPSGIIFAASTGRFTGLGSSSWNFKSSESGIATYSSCSLTSSGGIKCFGKNSAGQLGNGTYTNSLTPVDVSGLTSGAASVTSGNQTICALTTAGGVKCWGYNGSGALGNGAAPSSFSNIPVDVTGLTSGAQQVSAGYKFGCALTTAGGVKCWGSNTNGQLGNGTLVDSLMPVDVTGLTSGVTKILAGGYHACALLTAGGVKCWGGNTYGQLGNGTLVDSSTPVNVTGLGSGVSDISAGYAGTCALTTVGGVQCWGDNSVGALGAGNNNPSSVPVSVSGLSSGVSSIAVGDEFVCAVLTSQALNCWGYNIAGQLGNGTTVSSNVPITPTGLSSGVASIATGVTSYTACASLTDGSLRCWGSNAYGQFGNGTTTSSLVPTTVPNTGPQPGFPVSLVIHAADAGGHSSDINVTLSAN